MKYFSTTATAKRLGLEAKALFAKLQEVHFIVRESEKWALTAKGKLAGGRIKTSVKLGDYIEWPEDFDLAQLPAHQSPDVPVKMISATNIGSQFGITANKLNHLFSELGWVDKSLKGWLTTEQGLKQGAVQSEDSRTGVPYVKWPETIAQSNLLLNSINAINGSNSSAFIESHSTTKTSTPSESKTNHDAIDGHCVYSNAHMIIDNWLYIAEIVHAYKRKLPIEENVFCDFYLPTAKVYIEYWRDDKDPKYLALKDKKLTVYAKHRLKLIQLNACDTQNLDEVLPRLLLKFGVQTY